MTKSTQPKNRIRQRTGMPHAEAAKYGDGPFIELQAPFEGHQRAGEGSEHLDSALWSQRF